MPLVLNEVGLSLSSAVRIGTPPSSFCCGVQITRFPGVDVLPIAGNSRAVWDTMESDGEPSEIDSTVIHHGGSF
jgi:hypothetical protein